MQILADLQLHSKYSRAVSSRMDLTEIATWCVKKGIDLVATGDWTHPLWFREIKNNLKEVSPGIFSLKSDGKGELSKVRFLLSTEISSIYLQGQKQRRVHNLIFSPSIATCEKIIREMQRRGSNLMSDGRPIVGISSKDLLEMTLNIDPEALFIPAHAWTPWFSIFGSKSGFDSIEECFGNLSKHIFAIETGLSSDPIMNWQIKDLDNRSLLSFSDAHSGPKLGREATVFIPINNPPAGGLTIDNLSYQDIVDAIKQNPKGKLKIGYTIEFFPEEGKYHWSGHRVCNIRYNPLEVKEKGTVCPVCHRPLTIGVENRVNDLAGQTIAPSDCIRIENKAGMTFIYDPGKKRRPFVSLVPLLEVLMELNNGSPTKAGVEYERLTTVFGTEFDIIFRKTYEELVKTGGEGLAQAIARMRRRDVTVDPGYDGVFGTVRLHKPESVGEIENKKEESQPSLF